MSSSKLRKRRSKSADFNLLRCVGMRCDIDARLACSHADHEHNSNRYSSWSKPLRVRKNLHFSKSNYVVKPRFYVFCVVFQSCGFCIYFSINFLNFWFLTFTFINVLLQIYFTRILRSSFVISQKFPSNYWFLQFLWFYLISFHEFSCEIADFCFQLSYDQCDLTNFLELKISINCFIFRCCGHLNQEED